MQVRVRSASPAYFVALQFQGGGERFTALKDYIKAVPGSKYVATAKAWALPIEMLPQAAEYARSLGAEVLDTRDAVGGDLPTLPAEFEKLKDFQKEGVRRALSSPARRWVFADETGLGKTPQAIVAARALRPRTTLIVCMAIARDLVWKDELAKWWPDHPHVECISWTRAREKGLSAAELARKELAFGAPIQIVSYALLDQVAQQPWDVIIFDEGHSLQHPDSGQSEAALALTEANPEAAVFLLSATIMPNRPQDAYGPLSVVWPHRWGELVKNKSYSYAFNHRYVQENLTDDGYRTWAGLREEHAPELAARIGAVSSRTTKKEVAHLLPSFDVRVLRIPQGGRAVEGEPVPADALPGVFKKEGRAKLSHVLNWTEEALGSASHVAILTSFRPTSRFIAACIRTKRWAKDVPVYVVNGDDPADKRAAAIRELKAQPRGVLVATMHSIGISIDLTFCTKALFAELYSRPERIIQALGRFSRLSGTVPSSCDFLVFEGGPDMKIAYALKTKTEALSELMKSGVNDDALGLLAKDPVALEAELAALTIDSDLMDFDFGDEEAA